MEDKIILQFNGFSKKGIEFLRELKENNTKIEFTHVEFLSKNGDMREAAANLFFRLHELEIKDLDLILVEPVEETGLGIAIMDRLIKATNRYL